VLHPDCATDGFQHIVLLKEAEGNGYVDDVFVGSMCTLLMGKMIYGLTDMRKLSCDKLKKKTKHKESNGKYR
jgi:hypothetical protein